MNLSEYFRKLRFDKDHHLGMGDIRLTLGQQEEIVEALTPKAVDSECAVCHAKVVPNPAGQESPQ